VKTMTTRERADLTVKPQYGFGETGKLGHDDEGSVPPNATLQITLELVSWKKIVSEVIDFTKEVVKEGEGYEFPSEGSIVKLKLIGMLHDGTIFLKKGRDDDEAELFEFKTDEEEVIDGLDRGVMTMKKGEVALLTIPPQYAFGSSESQQELAMVPPNSTLYYEVELVSFNKDNESSEMNNEEKIEVARKKQEEGNALYNAKKYARASKRYEQAVKFIEYYNSFSDVEKESAWELKFSCILSNAACQLLLKNHKKYWKLIDEAETPELRRKTFMLRNMDPRMDVTEVTDIEMYLYKKKCEIKSWIHETMNWGRSEIKSWIHETINWGRKVLNM
jgi:FK506-binding protein 4/5